MEVRLRSRISRDWLNLFVIAGITVGYVLFSLFFIFRPELGWGRVVFFIGGGGYVVAHWVSQLAFLTLRQGVLERGLWLPLSPTNHQEIDLRTVTAATLDTRSMPYVEHGHLLPALVLTRLPGTYMPERQKEELEIPLPRGRTLDEAEVKEFVLCVNKEIQRLRV